MNVSGGKVFDQKDNQGNIYNADVINISYQTDSGKSQIHIDWCKVCEAMLLNSHLRRKATEKGFEVNVYVPLGLVERKQQPRRKQNEDVKSEEVYQVEKEAISQIYQHDEFLQEIIVQTPTAKNKHIAIVGEPGAGKTTLLINIASFILKPNPSPQQGEILPIFVSLASLQGRTLQDYLLKTWLPNAISLFKPEVGVTPEIENELIKRFSQGGMWLLLDGVDEMASTKALDTIEQQLTGWLTQARVVLTCRMNVWDANLNNPLSDFDTYRTQDFRKEQINQFIGEWFAQSEKPELGKQLQTKLKETGRERICELVRNPLRLSLLCQIFYLNKEAELPKTKAGLYQRFIRYFYGWKQPNVENKEELHSFLSQLAVAGMDSQARFRLSESLAIQKNNKDLFELACKLGWLNLVNRDAESDESVYAFFHPTFQEYFAACAIEDWDFFLPRKHKNKPIKDKDNLDRYKPYRIFEPQWREVILLWLGLEDSKLRQQQEQFIDALVRFQDGCGDLYRYRAYFLAAAGISEFKDHPQADKIVAQVIEWRFEEHLSVQAQAAIQDTDRTKAIAVLEPLIYNSPSEYISMQAASSLGQIDKDNPKAIAAFVQLIDKSQFELTRSLAAESLGLIAKDSPEAITALVQLINNLGNESTRKQAASSLGLIAKDNPQAIAALEQLIDNSQSEYTRSLAAENLGKIHKDNLKAIAALEQLIDNFGNQYSRIQAAESLGQIDKDNPKAIAALVQLIDNFGNEYTSKQAAYSLGQIAKDNPKAIATLVQLIDNSQHKYIRIQAAYSLGQIAKDNPKAIATLVELIDNSGDKDICMVAAESLGQIAKDNSKAIAVLEQLMSNSQDEYTLIQAASSLVQIAKDNPKAIAVLEELMSNSQDEYIRRQAASSLVQIAKDNSPKVITALVRLIDNSRDQYTCEQAASSLGQYAQNIPYPTFYQAYQQERSDVVKRLLNFPKYLSWLTKERMIILLNSLLRPLVKF